MATRGRTRWVSLVVVVGVGACGSSDDSGGSGGAVTPSGEAGTPVPCVHTTTDDPMRRDSDVLPSGACAAADTCSLVVRAPCTCAVQSPRQFYDCTCEGGTWSCSMTSQDTGVCPMTDAGACALDGG